jgi:GNAT superfamily N-acetyltransferase
METVLLGWPPDGPTIRLDYRRFSYAGKFVMSNTGKAVVRATGSEGSTAVSDPAETFDDVLAAVAFNADRTDSETLWLRYVTVRNDRRGDGLGPKLCAFVADRAVDRDYETLRIAVNNPFAYEALYRAGFEFTGRETGLAELVLARPADDASMDRSEETYQAGLDRYRTRDLSDEETAFLERKRDSSLPAPVLPVG